MPSPYIKTRQKHCYREHLRNVFGVDWKKHWNDQDCKDYVVGNKKAVEQIDIKTGEVIKVYESLSAATRKMGVRSPKAIWKACNGELKTAYGFGWTYKEMDFGDLRNYGSGKVGRPGKQVEQINVENNEVIKTWDSVKEAQNEIGTFNIDKCCRGERETAKGFKWRYKENGKLGAA